MRNKIKLLTLLLSFVLFTACGHKTDEKSYISVNNSANSTSNVMLEPVPESNLELYDQYGKKHKLSDYKGKKVFLNFMWTGCIPCRNELPYINTLYKNFGSNGKNLIVLSVVLPKSSDFTQTNESDVETVKEFLKKYNVEYPVLFDTEGKLFNSFGIMVFPTTYMINESNKIYGYITGALTYEQMENIVSKSK